MNMLSKCFPFMFVVLLTISCITQSSGARSRIPKPIAKYVSITSTVPPRNTQNTTKAPKQGWFQQSKDFVENNASSFWNYLTKPKPDKKSLETDQSDNGEGKNNLWGRVKAASGEVLDRAVSELTPVAVKYANKGIDNLASKWNAEISKSHQSHSEIDQEPHQVDHRYHESADMPHGYGQQHHDINYVNAYSNPGYPGTGYPHSGYQYPTHHQSGYPHSGYHNPTHHQSGYPNPGYQPTASPHLGYQHAYQYSASPKPAYTNYTNYRNYGR